MGEDPQIVSSTQVLKNPSSGEKEQPSAEKTKQKQHINWAIKDLLEFLGLKVTDNVLLEDLDSKDATDPTTIGTANVEYQKEKGDVHSTISSFKHNYP
jgi:hypothetical protein